MSRASRIGTRSAEPRHPHSLRPLADVVRRQGRAAGAAFFPAFNSLGTLKRVLSIGYDYSWFVLTSTMAAKEFVLSGSEQNLDFTSKSISAVLRNRRGGKAPASVKAFIERGEDFVVRDNLDDLIKGMNELTGDGLIDGDRLRGQIEARDREVDNLYAKDAQIIAINGARKYSATSSPG